MNFEEFKAKILAQAKASGACSTQYARAAKSTSIEELIEVIKDNLSFAKNNNILSHEIVKEYGKPELFNIGKDNSGFFNSGDLNSGDLNSGDLNSGDLNSGYLNSGYLNSGYRNSGDRNSGDRNSGDLNSGDLNSGYRNSGYRNSGDRNSGDLNSGDLNSGDLNSGDLNSGYRNSGDLNSGDLNSGYLNSGYRNSGVFCTRKRQDTVPFFNSDSNMSWDDWYNHPVYDLSRNLNITQWIDWDEMSEDEKKEYPKAFVCGGRLMVFDYHTAWNNLWETLNDSQKASFKTLPNFNYGIFKEVTGIDFE
jgi:hypothetical protein